MSAEAERAHGGPIGVAPDLGRIEEGLARRTSELIAAARRVRTGADADAIHDLRVATRRLTAALRAWESLIPARAGRGAFRALRRLRRRLGEARELEVHLALVESRPMGGRAGRAAVEAILDRLRERLARRRRAAMKRVSPRRLRRLVSRIETAAGAVRVHGDPGPTAEAQATERWAAERTLTALRWAAERPDDVTLHEARIRVKQWRYLLECLEEALPGGRWRAAQTLRGLQTLLGDIHDWGLLRDLFAREALEPMSEEERAGLNARIVALDQKRRRAVRRFQRSAREELATTPGAAHATAPGEAIAPGDAPDAGAPPALPADAPRAERASEGEPENQERRWGSMASWLEKSGDES